MYKTTDELYNYFKRLNFDPYIVRMVKYNHGREKEDFGFISTVYEVLWDMRTGIENGYMTASMDYWTIQLFKWAKLHKKYLKIKGGK